MYQNGINSEDIELPFDPFIQRDSYKLTTIYALSWEANYELIDTAIVADKTFNFGRLSKFYESNINQFPKVITSTEINPKDVIFKRLKKEVNIHTFENYLLCLPSNKVICFFSISFKTELDTAILMMEDFYYNDFTITDVDPITYLEKIDMPQIIVKEGAGFESAYHQIFTFNKEYIKKDIDTDLIQKIIYRANLPCREDQSSIMYPNELNRRPYTFCGLGPFVTAIGGHQGYMEDCILVSAINIVGSTSIISKIRKELYDILDEIKNENINKLKLKKRREVLNFITKRLSELQLEISLFVEAPTNIGLIVPALRLESYHNALCISNEIPERIKIVSNMVERIEKLVVYVTNQIGTIEREADEAHRTMWTVIVSFISAISIPPALILSFFGANVVEVKNGTSLFDVNQYWWLYSGIFGSILISAIIGIAVWLILKPNDK